MRIAEEREPIVLLNNGQKIFGVMHRPLNTEKSPFVLMCHGLGGQKVGRGRLYVHLAEKLVARGIGALRIDFRGSGDSEGQFSSMTIDSEVSDALVALEFLKNNSCVDSKSIALFGRSFGGVVAVLAGQKFGEIKSMALWAPVFGSDQWKEKWLKAHSGQMLEKPKASMPEFEGLQPGYPFFEQLFALKLNEPLQKLSKIPLLHIHGEKDTIVDLTHAQKYREHRQGVAGKTQFMQLPQSDHDFNNLEERYSALEETVQWFEDTLKA